MLVWIHGGGYGAGGATGLAGVDVFDGKYPILRAQGDLVVVVIQYRLGMYGFLAGSDVQAAGAANLGLSELSSVTDDSVTYLRTSRPAVRLAVGSETRRSQLYVLFRR